MKQDVYVADPTAGPVHVDDGAPLVWADGGGEVRSVETETPIVAALLADGVLAVAPEPDAPEPSKATGRRGRGRSAETEES